MAGCFSGCFPIRRTRDHGQVARITQAAGNHGQAIDEQAQNVLLEQLSIEARLDSESRDAEVAWELYSSSFREQLEIEDQQLARALEESIALLQYPPPRLDVPSTSTSASAPTLPECKYCCTTFIQAAFDPCGHAACLDCALRIENGDRRNCPECRASIVKTIKFYIT